MKKTMMIIMTVLACSVFAGNQPEKVLTPAEEALQKRMIEEFGDFGKDYASASSYKVCTWKELRASKTEYENKKVQYEGKFMMFNDNFPGYVIDSGYSSKKYYYMIVESMDFPVLAKRDDNVTQMLSKLKRGAKIRIYGRVKEFKSKNMKGMMPEYFIEFASATVLNNEVEEEAAKPDKDRRPKRPWKH